MQQKTWLRVLRWLVTVGVVALTYAALDDITTGTEPSHRLEWIMVAIGAAWFIGLGVVWSRGGRSVAARPSR